MKASSATHDDTVRAIMRWIIAAFYVWGGYAHLHLPDVLMMLMPDIVPFPRQVIFVTGLLEFAMAAALLTKPFRKWAGIAMAVYAICVWPANIKHFWYDIDVPGLGSNPIYHAIRLPLQPDCVVGFVLRARRKLAFPAKAGLAALLIFLIPLQ
jgi:uncharacterized membrane protein